MDPGADFRQPLHPVAASGYFCSRWFFFLDLMHLMDCKGVTAIVAGGVLGVLVRHRGLAPNKFVRLQTINAHKEEWHGARPRPHRLPTTNMEKQFGAR